MSAEHLTLFITLTFFVSLSPGPVMLACMTYGGQVGVTRTLFAMAGASAGNLLLIGLSAIGASLLLKQHPWLFQALQWCGAAWLIWLGVQTFLRRPETIQAEKMDALSAKRLWWQAFVIALSNPKGLLYFGALFPQFLRPEQALLPQYFILVPVFLVIDLAWMLIYAKSGSAIMRWIKNPRHQRGFNRVTGSLLALAGLLMAFGF